MTTPDDAAPIDGDSPLINWEHDGYRYELTCWETPPGGKRRSCYVTEGDLQRAGFTRAADAAQALNDLQQAHVRELSAERLARAEVERALREELAGLREVQLAYERVTDGLFAWADKNDLRATTRELARLMSTVGRIPEAAKAAEGEVDKAWEDSSDAMALEVEAEYDRFTTEPQSPAGEKDSSPSLGATDADADSGAEKPREAAPVFSLAPDSPGDGAGDPAGGGEERVIGQRCAACGAEWLTDMQVDELSDAVEERCGERLAEIRRLRAERDELRRGVAAVAVKVRVRALAVTDHVVAALEKLLAQQPPSSAKVDAPTYECNCIAPYPDAVHDLTCPEHLKRFPEDRKPKYQGGQGPTEALREQICQALRKHDPSCCGSLARVADELEGKR